VLSTRTHAGVTIDLTAPETAEAPCVACLRAHGGARSLVDGASSSRGLNGFRQNVVGPEFEATMRSRSCAGRQQSEWGCRTRYGRGDTLKAIQLAA